MIMTGSFFRSPWDKSHSNKIINCCIRKYHWVKALGWNMLCRTNQHKVSDSTLLHIWSLLHLFFAVVRWGRGVQSWSLLSHLTHLLNSLKSPLLCKHWYASLHWGDSFHYPWKSLLVDLIFCICRRLLQQGGGIRWHKFWAGKEKGWS